MWKDRKSGLSSRPPCASSLASCVAAQSSIRVFHARKLHRDTLKRERLCVQKADAQTGSIRCEMLPLPIHDMNENVFSTTIPLHSQNKRVERCQMEIAVKSGHNSIVKYMARDAVKGPKRTKTT